MSLSGATARSSATSAFPDGVDTDKVEANFKKGVLTVTLPKKAEAQKPAKKIDVKTAA